MSKEEEVSMLSLIFLAYTAAADFDDFYAQKLKDCGGRIYTDCDTEPSQQTIFEAAVDEAKKTNRKLFVIFGADWCGPCIVLDKVMNANPDELAELKKDFVIVHIQAERVSGHKIRSMLNAFERFIPQAVFYDPASREISEAFQPPASLPKIRAALGEHPITWPANH